MENLEQGIRAWRDGEYINVETVAEDGTILTGYFILLYRFGFCVTTESPYRGFCRSELIQGFSQQKCQAPSYCDADRMPTEKTLETVKKGLNTIYKDLKDYEELDAYEKREWKCKEFLRDELARIPDILEERLNEKTLEEREDGYLTPKEFFALRAESRKALAEGIITEPEHKSRLHDWGPRAKKGKEIQAFLLYDIIGEIKSFAYEHYGEKPTFSLIEDWLAERWKNDPRWRSLGIELTPATRNYFNSYRYPYDIDTLATMRKKLTYRLKIKPEDEFLLKKKEDTRA
ncbi:MAG TPA: hypothetical protein PKM99_05040 [Thermotogota bacterium]|nr:hypothetical protein [Thermotogota bacterium]HOZ12698.1 hypothetical protein [Thermotogota bacterium]HPB87983.1 hypothetical protein [Thermotogota bacterium]HPH11336.1 hypothetical protein [Thermotogota bacterium]HQN21911.1 hypothetical protein [Thermotogota bacterium]